MGKIEPKLVKNKNICETTNPTIRPAISVLIDFCLFLGAFSASFNGGGVDWTGATAGVTSAICAGGFGGSNDEEADGSRQDGTGIGGGICGIMGCWFPGDGDRASTPLDAGTTGATTLSTFILFPPFPLPCRIVLSEYIGIS